MTFTYTYEAVGAHFPGIILGPLFRRCYRLLTGGGDVRHAKRLLRALGFKSFHAYAMV